MHVNLEPRSSDLGARGRTPPMYRFRAGNSSPRSILLLLLETIPHSPFRSNFRVLKCRSWSMHGDGVSRHDRSPAHKLSFLLMQGLPEALQCGFLRVTCTITCPSIVVLFYYTFLVYVCRNSIFSLSFSFIVFFSYFSSYYWKSSSLWFIGTRNSTNGTMKLNIYCYYLNVNGCENKRLMAILLMSLK